MSAQHECDDLWATHDLVVKALGGAHDRIKTLETALGPSEGGSADFSSELDVIADVIDRYDAGSGLGRHLRERATSIRAVLSTTDAQPPRSNDDRQLDQKEGA